MVGVEQEPVLLRPPTLPKGPHNVVDHSRIPTDRDFVSMLDEIEDLLKFIRQHAAAARGRAKAAVKDGYPTRSMPESDIAGGRTGDPTADFVVALAGGRVDEDDEALGPDTWRGPFDPIGNAVRNLDREVLDARNRLRGAASSLRQAMPARIPDPVREECVSCGVSKAVATKHGSSPKGWVVGEGRCSPCSARLRRHGTPVGQ